MNTDKKVIRTKSQSYFLVSKEPQEFIGYEPRSSYFLCFGIENSNLNVEQDTKSIVDCFSEAVLPRSHVDVQVVPGDSTACAVSQIEREFKLYASHVRRDGLFIFYYAGPAVKVSEAQWSLVSSDVDSQNPFNFITAESLVAWLNDAQSEAKEVLMVLSCPFADKITSGFRSIQLQSVNISAIALPTANEQMASLSRLKSSTCHLFLCQAVTSYASSGVFQLKRIYERTAACCKAFSELIVTYDPVTRRLNRDVSETTLAAVRRAERISLVQDCDETDGGAPGNFSFLTRHFGPSTEAGGLHPYVDTWLQSAEDLESGPLSVLRQRNALSDQVVISAVVCVLMSSVASIQAAFQPASACSSNLLIVAFMKVSATVTSVYHEANLGVEHFKASYQHYSEVLSACGLETQRIRSLYDKVCRDS